MSGNFVGSLEELTSFFENAFKPQDQWKIGCEFEKLGVDPSTGRAVPFSGPGGVERILLDLAERFGWETKEEASRVLALERGASRITLEPGSQLELSSLPHETLHGLAGEFAGHIDELLAVSEGRAVEWLGLGIQPVSHWEEIELLPKTRYDIMTRQLPRCGVLGLAMMRETASTQVNLDYDSEADAIEKFRLAMALSPLLTALFANSAISRGASNGFLSRRAHIWQNTDPHRCGFIERIFRADAGLADYVEYALDVPMLFIVRQERWVDIGEVVTFRQFLASGFGQHRASREDWALHLSTLFTEVRFKPFLEIRGADCPPPGLAMAFPALVKGILYDREARKEAWEIVRSWSLTERRGLYQNVSLLGPRAQIRGIPLRDPIREIVRISSQGLKRQACRNDRGLDETIFLEPLQGRLDRGWECPAREILDFWEGSWNRDVLKLVDFCRFRAG